ncbi:MAG: polysaccharide deacetylase family protein, partial [Rhizobiales bacterium]|nr:polysaccharide deacetylase family protein [Hyphomicrobiales bacterium]
MPVTIRSLLRAMFTVPLLALSSPSAGAAECLGNPDALGTSRVLRIDPATTPPVGRKHFPQTLPLAPRELVLTFDD